MQAAIVLSLYALSAQFPSGEPEFLTPPVVMVLPVHAGAQGTQHLATALTTALREEAELLDDVTVHVAQDGGCADAACALKEARAAGADEILTGWLDGTSSVRLTITRLRVQSAGAVATLMVDAPRAEAPGLVGKMGSLLRHLYRPYEAKEPVVTQAAISPVPVFQPNPSAGTSPQPGPQMAALEPDMADKRSNMMFHFLFIPMLATVGSVAGLSITAVGSALAALGFAVLANVPVAAFFAVVAVASVALMGGVLLPAAIILPIVYMGMRPRPAPVTTVKETTPTIPQQPIIARKTAPRTPAPVVKPAPVDPCNAPDECVDGEDCTVSVGANASECSASADPVY